MVNKATVNLTKEFEGCKLIAYQCPAKIWTIGFGNTYYPNGQKVQRGDKVSLQEAEEMLINELNHFEDGVKKLVTVPLNENQLGALTSFSYNLGLGALKSSTLLKKLNAKDYTGASLEFSKWNKAGGKVLNGLVRRRKAEYMLFNTAV